MARNALPRRTSRWRPALVALLAATAWGAAAAQEVAGREPSACERDVEFALAEIEKRCGRFFATKGIDWRKVGKDLRAAASKAEGDEAHLMLLVRLLARLRDGHAQVLPAREGDELPWPADLRTRRVGPGFSLCQVDDRIYVRNADPTVTDLGIEPGCQVEKFDGRPALAWVQERIDRLRDTVSFSTDHQARFAVLHAGLQETPGTRLRLAFRDPSGKRRERTVVYERGARAAAGPALPPAGLSGGPDVWWGRTPGGWGYVHVRRCPVDLPEKMDAALEALGDVPGMILDFRGNSGGGFDHEALFGRFVPKGRRIAFAKAYESAGPLPFGGPVVVIVDATVVSAGETGSGMFKEDGRAYMIGESPTAGMSSRKDVIDLPSGRFRLLVSVASNMGRFNGGKGIEGIGVVPHEIVPFDPKDLAAHRDTLIRRAETLLADFPAKKVPYDPKNFGWKPPGR